MDSQDQVLESFAKAIERARIICHLQRHLSEKNTSAVNTDDLLRAAVVLAVSAFDYLIHELIRVQAVLSNREKRRISGLELPLAIVHCDPLVSDTLVSEHIRAKNAHKSFVDPSKLAEIVGVFVSDPWARISTEFGASPQVAKSRLRSIYRWRNRIAHEADINPEYAGANLWPIDHSDVISAIDDISLLGKSVAVAVRNYRSLTPATS